MIYLYLTKLINSLQEHQIGIHKYKTSGDFSYKNGDFLAVSDKYVDNLGEWVDFKDSNHAFVPLASEPCHCIVLVKTKA